MLASRMSKLVPITMQGVRQMSVTSGPPTVRISTAEKIVHGAILFVGMFTIPAWVLVNIKHYRNKE